MVIMLSIEIDESVVGGSDAIVPFSNIMESLPSFKQDEKIMPAANITADNETLLNKPFVFLVVYIGYSM